MIDLTLFWPFNAWCPQKGSCILNKPAVESCKFAYVCMTFLWTPGVNGLTFSLVFVFHTYLGYTGFYEWLLSISVISWLLADWFHSSRYFSIHSMFSMVSPQVILPPTWNFWYLLNPSLLSKCPTSIHYSLFLSSITGILSSGLTLLIYYLPVFPRLLLREFEEMFSSPVLILTNKAFNKIIRRNLFAVRSSAQNVSS